MIDLGKLAKQGRAYSGSRPWTNEELDALIRLEHERRLARDVAADYIRNGIVTLEAYDRAVEANFVPLTTEGAVAKAEALLKDNRFAKGEPVVAEPTVEPVVEAEPVVKKSGKKK